MVSRPPPWHRWKKREGRSSEDEAERHPNLIRLQPVHRRAPDSFLQRHVAVHRIYGSEGNCSRDFDIGPLAVLFVERGITGAYPEVACDDEHQSHRQNAAFPGTRTSNVD